jgi:hypothetical protein
MTAEKLVPLLAERVFGWRTAPDRFLTGSRSWIPHWKFNPLRQISDAFQLLDASEPSQYAICLNDGQFHVDIEIRGNVGTANDRSRQQAIIVALARSLKLEGANS